MKKGDLRKRAGISGSAMAKLGASKNVNVDTLMKICLALECEIGDILEIVPDKPIESEPTDEK
jgi:DNA-binding Xre family transcriptional regulator